MEGRIGHFRPTPVMRSTPPGTSVSDSTAIWFYQLLADPAGYASCTTMR